MKQCTHERILNPSFDVHRIAEYVHKIGTKSGRWRLIYNTLQSEKLFGTALETGVNQGETWK